MVGLEVPGYDSATTETINGLYKAEVIHRQSWRNREAVEMATLKGVHWFNHHRLLGPIGNNPPAETESGLLSATSRAVESDVTQTKRSPGKLRRFMGAFK